MIILLQPHTRVNYYNCIKIHQYQIICEKLCLLLQPHGQLNHFLQHLPQLTIYFMSL